MLRLRSAVKLEMHRSFNYHVCELKIRLEKSSR